MSGPRDITAEQHAASKRLSAKRTRARLRVRAAYFGENLGVITDLAWPDLLHYSSDDRVHGVLRQPQHKANIYTHEHTDE